MKGSIGLRSQILGVILSVILLATLAGIVFQLVYHRSTLYTQTINELDANATDLLNSIHREVHDTIQILWVVAARDLVKNGCSVRNAELRRYLLSLVQDTGHHLSLAELTDKNGKVCASSDDDRIDMPIDDPEAFAALQKGDEFVVSPLKKNGANAYMMIEMRIMSDDGHFNGALRIRFEYGGKIQRSFNLIEREMGSLPVLIDHHGTIRMAPSHLQELLATRNEDLLGPSPAVTLEGIDYIMGSAESMGYRSYIGQRWRLVLLKEAAVALAPMHAFMSYFLIFMIAMGGLFMLFGWLAAARLLRPIDRLIAFTRAIGTSGDIERRLPVVHNDEVGQLTMSFNRMLSRLQSNQTKIQASEERNRTMLEVASALGEGFVIIQEHSGWPWQIFDWNSAAQNMLALQVQPEGLPSLTDFLPYDDNILLYLQFTALRQNLLTRVPPLTVRMHHGNGSIFTVELSAALSDYQGAPSLVVIFRDVTERYQMQQQLIQAQKMEALGTMAGGFVHDFNNLLAALLGYITLLKNKIATQPAGTYVIELERIALRGADMVKNMLVFSRNKPPTNRQVPLADVVEEVRRLVQSSSKQAVSIEVEGCLDFKIRGDQSQLVQVFLNLLLNASDAIKVKNIPDGYIRLRCAPYAHKETMASMGLPFSTSSYVLVEVEDNGIGMDEEVQQRLFEPFFTTKGERGTGMGLAITYRIIKNHGGEILVESVPGEGSTFKIFLPLGAPSAVDSATMPAISADALPLEGRHLLIVDDEVAIRKPVADMLSTRGYTVDMAADGMEALEKCRKTNFDAIILDLTMPQMDGYTFMERLLAFRPDARVIIASGNIDDKTADLRLARARAIMPKPFDLHTITSTLEKVLREP